MFTQFFCEINRIVECCNNKPILMKFSEIFLLGRKLNNRMVCKVNKPYDCVTVTLGQAPKF